MRVVADHVRSGLMLITDGVTPVNEARGYVLRRLLRRAVRSLRLLGVDEPVLLDLRAGQRGPDAAVATRSSRASFGRIIAGRRAGGGGVPAHARVRARTILDTAVSGAKAPGRRRSAAATAFQLHDTYGFPIDLTLEMAAEQGLSVDEGELPPAHDRAARPREGGRAGEEDRARRRRRLPGDRRPRSAGPVVFTGYDESSSEGRVAGLLVDGEPVRRRDRGRARSSSSLDRTPFYAEGGGQLADAGRIERRTARSSRSTTCSHRSPVSIVHRAPGPVAASCATGALAQALVDVERRKAISRSHTATHMVHKAIREALGDTATQAGSENAPGRFRFDFHAGSGAAAERAARRRGAGQRAAASRTSRSTPRS